MIKHYLSLLVGTLLFIIFFVPNAFGQNCSCSTFESISELHLSKNTESNFIIFAEDSHDNTIENYQHLVNYIASVKYKGYNQLLFEIGVAYEYVASLEDTILISKLVGPLNYAFLKNIAIYNNENADSPIRIRGFDVETYPPFALKVLDLILDKYGTRSTKIVAMQSLITSINLMNDNVIKNDSIINLANQIITYVSTKPVFFNELDSYYLDKIADNLKAGILFNFKNWKLRENYIYQSIVNINKETNSKSIMLIGSQHVDKKVYRNVPSFYTTMKANGMLKPETDIPPIIIFNKKDDLSKRLRLYKISKNDSKIILEYLNKHNGLVYCKYNQAQNRQFSFLFVD